MDLKEEILIRSEQLFMKVGIKSVTMDDVSRELGISKKTLYQHFENKDQLVDEVVKTHVERERTCTDEICEGAKDALEEMVRIGVFLASTIEDVSQSTLFDLQKYHFKTWKILMSKQDEHIINSIVRNMKKGIGEGHYRKDVNLEVIARIYAKATYMVVDEMSNPNSKFSRREMIWELHNYHIHSIATPEGLRLWKQYNSEIKY